jgi:hypothetical protein
VCPGRIATCQVANMYFITLDLANSTATYSSTFVYSEKQPPLLGVALRTPLSATLWSQSAVKRRPLHRRVLTSFPHMPTTCPSTRSVLSLSLRSHSLYSTEVELIPSFDIFLSSSLSADAAKRALLVHHELFHVCIRLLE